MYTPKFTRVKEDFTCAQCGGLTKGNGFTNHCAQCLWSKHVDINPGDRASECGGLMKPVNFEFRGHDQIITHRCNVCGIEKKNKVTSEDNYDAILKLSSRPIF